METSLGRTGPGRKDPNASQGSPAARAGVGEREFSTLADRLAHADTPIPLHLPFALRLWRVARWTATGWGCAHADMPGRYPERFNREFFTYFWRTLTTGQASCARLSASA